MGKRRDLQWALEAVLGSRNVYFQPPASINMSYPCIVYKQIPGTTLYASNSAYFRKKRYQITVIDKNPDSAIPDKIADLPLCSIERCFTADNLNHFIYNLYY